MLNLTLLFLHHLIAFHQEICISIQAYPPGQASEIGKSKWVLLLMRKFWFNCLSIGWVLMGTEIRVPPLMGCVHLRKLEILSHVVRSYFCELRIQILNVFFFFFVILSISFTYLLAKCEEAGQSPGLVSECELRTKG